MADERTVEERLADLEQLYDGLKEENTKLKAILSQGTSIEVNSKKGERAKTPTALKEYKGKKYKATRPYVRLKGVEYSTEELMADDSKFKEVIETEGQTTFKEVV